jgi:thiol-disulfide isomerase/thioredoxin
LGFVHLANETEHPGPPRAFTARELTQPTIVGPYWVNQEDSLRGRAAEAPFRGAKGDTAFTEEPPMPRLGRNALSLLVLVALAAPAAAQEGWTTDYNTAVREAKTKNRPIVIDFYMANCPPCKKLDATTFRDPAVAKRLAEQFVAVRLDKDHAPALVQHLGIGTFPTIVFAAPDSKILGMHAGFVDVARFQQQLDRALQESAAPAAVPANARDLAAAPARPAPVVRGVASDQPRTLLAQIRADYQAKLYVGCLERCKELLAIDASGPDAAEARRLADDIRNDPDKSRFVQAALTEALGDLYLASAETALRQGRWLEASALLERVQQICPASPQALTAKDQELKLRSKISGQPVSATSAP